MLETVLYRLNVDRKAKKAFAGDAEAWLGETRLDDAEQRLISRYDVRSLLDQGVNPMLVVGYWLECEPSHSLTGYLRRASGRHLDRSQEPSEREKETES